MNSEKTNLDLIGSQIGKICLYISVEIPCQPEFHQYLSDFESTRANRKPMTPLSSIALNGAQKAPKILRN
jgi:hypothetical protein